MKKLFYFILIFVTFSCQKEGEPLTLEKVNELNVFKVIPFEAKINGTRFIGQNISGFKQNKKLSILAAVDGQTYAITTEGSEKGIYFGEKNRTHNTITFQNESGVIFRSSKDGKSSNSVIQITEFDENRRLVSGIMSGTLYAPWEEKVELTNGVFRDVLVEIPFMGYMNAEIDSQIFDSDQCVHGSSTNGGITLDVISSSANSDTISINIIIEEKIKVKSYTINNQLVTARYNSNVYSSDVFRNQFTSDSGNLIITKVDTTSKKITGSFNFRASNLVGKQIEISKGNFEALMQN